LEKEGGNKMSLVNLASGAGETIRRLLAGKDLNRPVRIDLHSTGCCDASLGLCLDEVRKDDLMQEADGLTFVITPEVHKLAGQVTITCADDKDKPGFVLTSTKPISEWQGLGVCHIRT
jgi:Fe-S cluster assembly iron-binding protein IscA